MCFSCCYSTDVSNITIFNQINSILCNLLKMEIMHIHHVYMYVTSEIFINRYSWFIFFFVVVVSLMNKWNNRSAHCMMGSVARYTKMYASVIPLLVLLKRNIRVHNKNLKSVAYKPLLGHNWSTLQQYGTTTTTKKKYSRSSSKKGCKVDIQRL